MSASVTLNGTAYTVPTNGDTDFAATFSTFLQALPGLTSSIIQFGAVSGLTTSAVYARPGIAVADATEILLPCPKAGKLSALYAKGSSNASGGSVTVTVRKNAADAALLCTVANGASSASDTTNTVTVAAGDTVSVKCLGNAGYTSGLANLIITFCFTPS